jgi:hypothetical protein
MLKEVFPYNIIKIVFLFSWERSQKIILLNITEEYPNIKPYSQS